MRPRPAAAMACAALAVCLAYAGTPPGALAQTTYNPNCQPGMAGCPGTPHNYDPYQGEVFRGAARGAARGAIIGGITGDAGRGAAIGATTGGIFGAARRAARR